MQHTNSAPPRSSTPSPRKRTRRDGWTTDRQVKFIIAFKTRSVTRAAAAAGMSRESAYRLRDRPGHADFARPWDAAVARKGHNRFAESHNRARTVTTNICDHSHPLGVVAFTRMHVRARAHALRAQLWQLPACRRVNSSHSLGLGMAALLAYDRRTWPQAEVDGRAPTPTQIPMETPR